MLTHTEFWWGLGRKESSAGARNRWEDSINKERRGEVYFVLEYGKWLDVVSIVMA